MRRIDEAARIVPPDALAAPPAANPGATTGRSGRPTRGDGPDSAGRLLAELVRRLEANLEVGSLVDPSTGPHLARIAGHCAAIAARLGFDAAAAERLACAAPLHDIGKLAIPEAILAKPGPLTPEERSVMRTHARLGHDLLCGSASPILAAGARIALRHHERYDGSGYPDGLAGDAIPIEARIVAVADVYDALVSQRPYKRAWTPHEAFGYLRSQRGRHLDPDCVDAMLALAVDRPAG
ncbi:MAG: HD domain-containing phosphohydrolase [Burkholderiales bacterium]